MKSKTKIGLILLLIGAIILVFAMVVAYLIHFTGSNLYTLLIVFGSIIYVGVVLIYKDLSQSDKGITLNIIGIFLIGFTALIIFLIDIWIESLIVLIVLFAILWFFIFIIPGLYKIIRKDDFPDLYKYIDVYASSSTIVLIICTILIAIFEKQNFSEYYFSRLGVILLFSILIPAIIALLIFVYFKVFHFP